MTKIAVITGASLGIGFQLAQQLSKKGIKVYAIARGAQELIHLKNLYPDHIIPIIADLSKKDSIEQIAKQLDNVKVDYLVNNAAILGQKLVKDMSYEDYQEVFAVNATAPALLIAMLYNKNLLAPSARIVNISSPSATISPPGLSAYAMSKAALNALSDTIEKEFVDSGILIGTFLPGRVETQMQEILREYPPVAASFKEAKESGRLIPPALSARWFCWLLLSAKTDEFRSAKSIYNSAHHSQWLLPHESLPPPLPTVVSGLPLQKQQKLVIKSTSSFFDEGSRSLQSSSLPSNAPNLPPSQFAFKAKL